MQRQRPGSELLNCEPTVSGNMAVSNQSASALHQVLRGYYRIPYTAFHTKTMSKNNDNCQHRHTLCSDLTSYGPQMNLSFMLPTKEAHQLISHQRTLLMM